MGLRRAAGFGLLLLGGACGVLLRRDLADGSSLGRPLAVAGLLCGAAGVGLLVRSRRDGGFARRRLSGRRQAVVIGGCVLVGVAYAAIGELVDDPNTRVGLAGSVLVLGCAGIAFAAWRLGEPPPQDG